MTREPKDVIEIMNQFFVEMEPLIEKKNAAEVVDINKYKKVNITI